MTEDYERPIDKIIREARDSGAFENLPGKGKPLNWENDQNVPEHLRMAHHVLHNSGYTLDWIELGRQLDAEYDTLRQRLDQARRAKEEGRLDVALWFVAVDDFKEKVRALNRRLLGYNVRIPHERFHKQPYAVDVNE